ncbi:DNA alkylation repair protein [uncultured Croceitalea sp.]|uniref:DNA alkylation repair protein n=1 Tax=uncultured Croceitalea sp. TaxID=1798908 RepID=UPI003305857C
MQVLTRKSQLLPLLHKCIQTYHDFGVSRCAMVIDQELLSKKVKFPLLEHCGFMLYNEIPQNKHLQLCDFIAQLKTIGGNVIIGIVLKQRLGEHFEESLAKATEYISKADSWHICDIIGERVFGHALLHHTERTIPKVKQLTQHSSNWVVRSLGAGFHNAIKWGLDKVYAQQLFQLLLTLGNTKDKEIKQGVGWAAKTTAKFHPEIIAYFKEDIQNPNNVGQWFRTKVRIGLERNKHAKGNRG